MGISLRHDVAGIGGSGSSGGGGGGGRGGKYGLDYMLRKQEMMNNNIQRDRDRMFQAAMAQQDFQNRNQLALNQFDIQKQMLDFADTREQAREKRIADRQDRLFARDATRADKLRAEEIARRDAEFQAGNQEFDRRRQMAADEFGNRQMHEQTMAARDNIGMRARQMLEQGEIADPKLAAKIRDLITDRQSVLLDPKWDTAQREQFLADYNSQLSGLMSQVPVRSQVEKANDGIQYLNMQTGQYQGTFDPNVPMTVIDQKSGLKYQTPGAQAEPQTPEQYYRQNPEEYKKDLTNEMARIQDEADAAGKPMDARAIRQEAQRRLRENYTDDQGFFSGRSGGGQGDDMAGMIEVLEKGSPEQKMEALGRLQGSPQMADIVAKAAGGEENAIRMVDAMQRAIPQKDRVESVAQNLQSADPSVRLGTLNDMRQMRDKGIMDDYAYTAAMVKGVGRPAKEIFESLGKTKYRGTAPSAFSSTVRSTAADLGMLDSKAFVRAFQASPKVEDVVKRIAEQGKMSTAEAEEYLYKKALSQNFASDLPEMLFNVSELSGKLEKDRKKKEMQSMFPDF